MSNDWSIDIEQSGRGGSIHYREGSHETTLDWEFGGEGAIALIFGTPSQHWDASIPWASGRQNEVLSRVAAEVIRLKAPGCRAELDLASSTIVIKSGRSA